MNKSQSDKVPLFACIEKILKLKLFIFKQKERNANKDKNFVCFFQQNKKLLLFFSNCLNLIVNSKFYITRNF